MQLDIQQVSGPPISHFYDGDERITYKTIALGSQGNFIGLSIEFSRRLRKLVDNAHGRILVWRQKPETSVDDRGQYYISARLAFYPELTDEVWSDCFKPKPEGDEAEFINQ